MATLTRASLVAVLMLIAPVVLANRPTSHLAKEPISDTEIYVPGTVKGLCQVSEVIGAPTKTVVVKEGDCP